MPEQGHLTITLPQGNTVAGQGYSSDIVPSGGHKFDLYCDQLQYEAQPPYRNVVLDQGEVDYQAVNPEQGVAWNLLEDVSRGAGTFFAGRGRFNNGKYSMAENFDAEYLCQGPRQVNEYPGIPFGVTPVGYYKAGLFEILWTDSAEYALYLRQQGEHFWHQIGGSTHYQAGATGLGTTWASLSTSPVKCVAHLGTYLMVGFGSAAKWLYTADYTGTSSAPTWVAEPEVTIANAEYAHVAMNATFETTSGTHEQCIVFMGNNGKLYKTTDLTADSATTGAAALADGGTIGNATSDASNSICTVDRNTLILIGKDSGLYSVDGAGNIAQELEKSYPIKTTSDSAGLAPANFRHVTRLGNGYAYWLVGDYTIIEREPVNGTYTEFSLQAFGPQNPRMQLPILAMCAGPNDKLYLTIGTNNSSLIDLSAFAAGTQTVANTITTGTSYLVKGFGHAHEGDWTWHLSLGSVTQLASVMWYTEEIQRLCVGFYTDSSDRAGFYFRYTQDDFGTYTDEDDVVRGTGTGSVLALDTLANGDALLFGFSRRFTSLAFDMGAGVNNNVSTLTVAYSDSDAGAANDPARWTTVTDMLDGTKDATATFARDGVLQWDLPATATNWVQATYNGVLAYWVRVTTNALLDNLSFTSILPGYSENLRQFVVVPGNPIMRKDTGPYDASGSIKVTTATAKFETGKFHDQRPLDGKAGRFFNAITQNLSAAGTLAVKYRTASDNAPSSGYTTLATYTSDALSLTGTAMAYDATNPPNFTEGIRFLLEIAPHASNTPIRLEAALFRFVNASVSGVGRKRKLTAVLSDVVDGPMTRQGHRARRSIKEIIGDLEAWRDAINPVASVVDNDLNLTMNMVLADFEPRLGGKEKNWQVTVTMVEVV